MNALNYRLNDGQNEDKLIVGNSLRYFNNNHRKSLIAKDNVKFFPNPCLNMNLCFEYVSE